MIQVTFKNPRAGICRGIHRSGRAGARAFVFNSFNPAVWNVYDRFAVHYGWLDSSN